MWKFHDSAKSAILPHLEALKFDYAFFHRLNLTKRTKFTAPKMTKKAVFALLDSPKLISRKI